MEVDMSNKKNKHVLDMAIFIKELIDKYSAMTLSWSDLVLEIKELISIEENRQLIFNGYKIRATVKTKLGVNRVSTLKKVLGEIDNKIYGNIK